MIIPALLPDELAWGYLCRVGRLNKLKSLQDIYDLISGTSSLKASNEAPGSMVHVLAALAGATPDSIITGHTLLPFARAVRAAGACLSHKDADDHIGRAALTFPFRQTAKLQLCPACVTEDIDFHGVSYWRRAHQLRGLVFCTKHACGLKSVQTKRWDVLPEHLADEAETVEPDMVEHALSSPVIRRYEEICSFFAMRARPFAMEPVSRLIQDRAQKTCPPFPTQARRMSTMALEQVGGPWLMSQFPGLHERRTGYVDSLDRTLGKPKVPLATQYYALALALLFPTADEAMMCLLKMESQGTTEIASSHTPGQETPTQVASRLGDNRGLAIRALLDGASIRQAATVAGVRMHDLEALVLACAKEGLSRLGKHVH